MTEKTHTDDSANNMTWETLAMSCREMTKKRLAIKYRKAKDSA